MARPHAPHACKRRTDDDGRCARSEQRRGHASRPSLWWPSPSCHGRASWITHVSEPCTIAAEHDGRASCHGRSPGDGRSPCHGCPSLLWHGRSCSWYASGTASNQPYGGGSGRLRRSVGTIAAGTTCRAGAGTASPHGCAAGDGRSPGDGCATCHGRPSRHGCWWPPCDGRSSRHGCPSGRPCARPRCSWWRCWLPGPCRNSSAHRGRLPPPHSL